MCPGQSEGVENIGGHMLHVGAVHATVLHGPHARAAWCAVGHYTRNSKMALNCERCVIIPSQSQKNISHVQPPFFQV